MVRRAFIVHGWQGHPKQGWYPWLGNLLETRGFEVTIPAMPNTKDPKPNEWIAALVELVGEPDADTYLIGHSMGANVIMKYLGLKLRCKIGGAVLVAPWPSFSAKDRKYGKEMGARWLHDGYEWQNILDNAEHITAIFSTNDPYVNYRDSEIFEKELRCKIIIEEGKSHMHEHKGVMELPSAYEAVVEQAGLV